MRIQQGDLVESFSGAVGTATDCSGLRREWELRGWRQLAWVFFQAVWPRSILVVVMQYLRINFFSGPAEVEENTGIQEIIKPMRGAVWDPQRGCQIFF